MFNTFAKVRTEKVAIAGNAFVRARVSQSQQSQQSSSQSSADCGFAMNRGWM